MKAKVQEEAEKIVRNKLHCEKHSRNFKKNSDEIILPSYKKSCYSTEERTHAHRRFTKKRLTKQKEQGKNEMEGTFEWETWFFLLTAAIFPSKRSP